MGASNSKPKSKPPYEEPGSGATNPSSDQTPLIANPTPAAASPASLNETEGSRQGALEFDESAAPQSGKKKLKSTPNPGPKMQKTLSGMDTLIK